MLPGLEEPWKCQKEGGVEVGGSEGSYRHSRPKQGPLQCSRLLETNKQKKNGAMPTVTMTPHRSSTQLKSITLLNSVQLVMLSCCNYTSKS